MRRLQRKRSKTFVRPMSYTGLEPRVQRQQPRSAIRPTTSTTTLPEQPEQQNGLTGMLAMKEGWDQGQKVRKGILDGTYEGMVDKFMDNVADRYDQVTTGLSNALTGGDALTQAEMINQATNKAMVDVMGGSAGQRWDLIPNSPSPMYGGLRSDVLTPLETPNAGLHYSPNVAIDHAHLKGGTILGGTPTEVADGMYGGFETTKVGDKVTGMDAGMDGGGGTPWLSYANIAKDLAMGSDKLTGNQWGDAAIRGGLAYATGGLSELGYAFGDIVDWW